MELYQFLCMLPVAVVLFSSDSIAIRYVLPVLRMTLYFHTRRLMGGRTGTVLCSSLALVDVAAAAHWLTGSAGRLAGTRWPGRALAVRRLESAAA